MRSLLAVLAVLAVSSAARADIFYQFTLNSATNIPITTHSMDVGQTVKFDVYVVANDGPNTNDRAKFQTNGLFGAGVRLVTPNTGIVGMVPVKETYDPNFNPAWNAGNAILGYVAGAPYSGTPGIYNYFNVIKPTTRVYDPEFFDENNGIYGRVGKVTGTFTDAAGDLVNVTDNVPTTMNAQLNLSPFQGDTDYAAPTSPMKTTVGQAGRFFIGTFTYTALQAGTGTLSTSDAKGTTVSYNVGGTATELDSVISQASVLITVVPEPSSMALCGAMAIAGGVGYYRRRKQAVAA